MTISGAEASQILDQLAKISVQISEKAALADITDDLAALRNEVSEEGTLATSLINRMINAQATLNNLEARVRALETGTP